MGDNSNSDIYLDLPSPSSTAGWLETGSMPAGDIRLLTEKPAEESDKPYQECSLLGEVLKELVAGIERILDGESISIELDATRIHFIPEPDDKYVTVRVEIMGIPDDVRGYEPNVVERDELVTEVYVTVRSWCDEALEVNPELDNSEWFRELKVALADAEDALEAAGITDIQ